MSAETNGSAARVRLLLLERHINIYLYDMYKLSVFFLVVVVMVVVVSSVKQTNPTKPKTTNKCRLVADDTATGRESTTRQTADRSDRSEKLAVSHVCFFVPPDLAGCDKRTLVTSSDSVGCAINTVQYMCMYSS